MDATAHKEKHRDKSAAETAATERTVDRLLSQSCGSQTKRRPGDPIVEETLFSKTLPTDPLFRPEMPLL